MNEITNIAPINPFAKMIANNNNSGSVAIEQERAIAEAQGQLIMAKRFPRDLNAAHAELMDACKIPGLAKVAFYSLPRGGQVISGPSIRLAEEIARVFGNFEFGHRELSRSEGKSEIEVYAWDKQTNNRSIRQLTVMHTMDTRDGSKKLRDQKDIDDKIANVASKQLRGRILAMMPKWMVEAAIEECRKTIAGDNSKPLSQRVRDMTQAFSKIGVSEKLVEARLGHKLDTTSGEEIADLLGIYTSIRDGVSKISEWFEPANESTLDEDGGAAAAVKAAALKPVTARAKKPDPIAAEPTPAAEVATVAEKEPEAPVDTPAPQSADAADAADGEFF